ncbi:MAG: hypothetical protein ACM3U1_10405 [Chloroflexota bacterium]
MKSRFSIPNNEIFAPAFARAQETDYEIIRESETACVERLVANRCEAALLTPMGYAQALEHVAVRIVPGVALAAKGYSGICSVSFNPESGGDRHKWRLLARDANEFLAVIAKLMLAERYGMAVELVTSGDYDAKLHYSNEAAPEECAIDLTEDWEETYEIMLPYAVWVCRAAEHPENITEEIAELSAIDLAEKAPIIEEHPLEGHEPREGELIAVWNEDMEEAAAQTLSLLFYHQYFKELPDINVLGETDD